MSLGLRPRPSLSGEQRGAEDAGDRGGVAGATAPAFVERPTPSPRGRGRPPVSLGLRPRPSLSVLQSAAPSDDRQAVSLGLRPRPSLSVLQSAAPSDDRQAVSLGLRPRPSLSVLQSAAPSDDRQAVSLGLRPRPSLSGRTHRHRPQRPGGVAGATAPAFVERTPTWSGRKPARGCRRGYGPGLRCPPHRAARGRTWRRWRGSPGRRRAQSTSWADVALSAGGRRPPPSLEEYSKNAILVRHGLDG